MPNFQALPNELLARAIGFLDKRSLAEVRLVNKRLEQISVARLFARITLYAHWRNERVLGTRYYILYENDDDDDADDQVLEEDEFFSDDLELREDVELHSHLDDSEYPELKADENLGWDGRPTFRMPSSITPMPQWAFDSLLGPPGYDACMFKNILMSATLNQYVKEVHIYTCNTDCDFHPARVGYWYSGDAPDPKFVSIYHECVERLVEFPNMRSITVHFDRHASGGHFSRGEIFQESPFQQQWLSKILRSVNHHVTEIAVRHYDNTSEPKNDLVFRDDAKVTSLRLSIKHEETNRLSVGPTYRCGDIHPFWERFPHFLEPLQQNLKMLVLCSDLPLGWFPKLDLRNVYFPQLKCFALGQHIFHHNRQIDWIISHSSTLEELYLDRCSILYQIGHTIPKWLDEEGYPKEGSNGYNWSSDPEILQDDNEFSRTLRFESINLRWHDIFFRFAEGLVLQDFRFGSSKQWKSTDSRYIEQGCQSVGLPFMPWEDEKNIENQILGTRYLIWDDMVQEYRPRWTSQAGLYNNNKAKNSFWRDEWKARFEPYPDCREGDQSALHALLEKIRGR